MEVYHVRKFRTLLSSHIPVACSLHHGDVLIATTGYSCKNTAALWHLHGCQRPIELSGHRIPITSLTFSTRDTHSSLLLCTASQHNIILWDVEQVLQANKNGHNPNGLVITIEKETTSVQCIGFSSDCYYVMVCVGSEGLIYHVKDGKLDTTITGHTGHITCMAFLPCQHDIVVTAAEDRTYMIWDIAQSVLIYRSSIISAHPFLSVAIDPSTGYIILGAADGKLRVYNMTDSHRCLHETDLGIKLSKLRVERQLECELQKYTEKSPTIGISRVEQPGVTLEEVQQSQLVEQGTAILSLYCHQPLVGDDNDDDDKLTFLEPTASGLKLQKVLYSSSQVWVAMHHSLAIVNADTMDVIAYWNVQDPILSTNDVECTRCTVPIAYSMNFCWNVVNAEMICASGAFAQGTVSVLSIKQSLECLRKDNNDDISSDYSLSVNACVPLCTDSPLRAELVPRISRPAKKAVSSGLTTKRRTVHDQPLTFHSKVKSSGYTAQPRSKLFVPNMGHNTKPTHKPSSTLSKAVYPTDGGIPLTLYHTTTLSAPINQISFSGDGKNLACGTVDKLAHALTMPPSSSKSKAFSGHGGSVTAVKWSEDNQWLLTCSTEKMARVWTADRKDPVLVINTVKHNFTSSQERDTKNVSFNKEVTHAQFFYMDKFILLTSANSLYLYKYNIDLGKVDEIKRYVTNNKYRLVKEFVVEQAQAITALSSINSFFSYIVVLGCSNKTLHVYDMNVGRCVRVINEVHSRHPHVIEQNKGSKYTTLPSGAHDLFLTSAVSDGIKLWDLRTCRCINRFEAHAESYHPLGVTFSPCGQFVGCGSENKCAYLYDIKSTDIHRLTGHSDVVSDVAFHPVHPLLATASLSGEIKYFRP